MPGKLRRMGSTNSDDAGSTAGTSGRRQTESETGGAGGGGGGGGGNGGSAVKHGSPHNVPENMQETSLASMTAVYAALTETAQDPDCLWDQFTLEFGDVSLWCLLFSG